VSEAEHTFLFTDLVGFSTLTELEGDHRGAEVAVSYYTAVRSLLPEHGAEEVKTLGDGLMLRCSDPASAIRLGLRIVDDLGAEPGFPAVRVGMHTGPAVAREGDWYGMTVNVAARLCAAAGGDEVLVSEATRRAAGRIRRVELEEPRLHWLKNVTEPVNASPARARAHHCAASSMRMRFAGRRVPADRGLQEVTSWRPA
jgi:class 3 adenylate cyclase